MQVLLTYNVSLSFYMLKRITAGEEVDGGLQVMLVRLRTLLTRLSFIQSKLEGKIEDALRQENVEVS